MKSREYLGAWKRPDGSLAGAEGGMYPHGEVHEEDEAFVDEDGCVFTKDMPVVGERTADGWIARREDLEEMVH